MGALCVLTLPTSLRLATKIVVLLLLLLLMMMMMMMMLIATVHGTLACASAGLKEWLST